MDRHFSKHAVLLLLFLILISPYILNQTADGRELRPSEHGLADQEPPSTSSAAGNASEMLSFFSGSPSATKFPAENNVTASWWNSGGSDAQSSRDRKKDGAIRFREVLFVASMVFGLTGVVLVAVSALLYLVQLRKQKPETTSLSEANVAHKQTQVHDL